MDIEKLIEQLNDFNENHIAVLCGSGQCACGYLCDKDDCIVVRAATALSTLQAENEKLRNEVERKRRSADDRKHLYENAERAYMKVVAELEQVKRERDAAQSTLAERIGVRGAEPITTAFGLPIDRLRELAEADREGRCMVVPSDYDGEMFKIWKGQILSSRRFVNNIKELGKTVFLTREEAEAALRREQE